MRAVVGAEGFSVSFRRDKHAVLCVSTISVDLVEIGPFTARFPKNSHCVRDPFK